jgi:hypothetical protein
MRGFTRPCAFIVPNRLTRKIKVVVVTNVFGLKPLLIMK